jgi:hypothetical protein
MLTGVDGREEILRPRKVSGVIALLVARRCMTVEWTTRSARCLWVGRRRGQDEERANAERWWSWSTPKRQATPRVFPVFGCERPRCKVRSNHAQRAENLLANIKRAGVSKLLLLSSSLRGEVVSACPCEKLHHDCKIGMAATFSCIRRRSASLTSRSQGRCKTRMGSGT